MAPGSPGCSRYLSQSYLPLSPVLAGWAPCGHDGGEGMTGDSWSLGAHQSCDRAGSVLSWKAGLRSPALSHSGTQHSRPLSSLHSAMFGPNLHGDAAGPQRAGLPRLICRAEEAAWLVSLPPPLVRAKTRAGRGRHNYHSQTRRGMRRLLINRHLRAMTGSSENILVGLQPNIPTLLLLLLLLRWF